LIIIFHKKLPHNHINF